MFNITLKYIVATLSSMLLLGSISIAHGQTNTQDTPQTTTVTAIAKVIEARGAALAINKQGKERTLTRGAALYAGEKLVTKKKASVKIRFTDGNFTSLQSNTEYIIEAYQYDPQGKDNRLTINLLVGGLRSISGKIGDKPGTHTIKTPVATIGIRGTVFSLLFDKVSYALSGQVVVGNIHVATTSGYKMDLKGGDQKRGFLTHGGIAKRLSNKELRRIQSPCQ